MPPIPWPLPPVRAGGRGIFYGVLQAGYARLQNPLIFSPLPNGASAVGERAGGGAKAAAYKGSSIAVELPDVRLNNYRTFSFLNNVRQHMASPSEIESREPEKRVVATPAHHSPLTTHIFILGAVPQSTPQKISKSLTFAPSHLCTFARSHTLTIREGMVFASASRVDFAPFGARISHDEHLF